MRRFFGSAGALILVVLLQAVTMQAAKANESLRVAYNSQWYPYSYGEGGEVKGILVELLDHILETRLDYPLQSRGYPWARAQHLVSEGKYDILFTFPSQQRLEYADRSDANVFNVQSRAFVRVGSTLASQLNANPDISQVGDARICVMLGDNWSENFYRKQELNFGYGRDTHNCLEQVAYDRSDLFIHASAASRSVLRQNDLDGRVVMLPEVYSSVPLAVLVSKKGNTPDDMLPRLNAVLAEMEADGSLQRLIEELTARDWPAPAASR